MFFCGFSPANMHCEFTYTTNAFQDESWDLSNSKGYEHSFMNKRVYYMLIMISGQNWTQFLLSL